MKATICLVAVLFRLPLFGANIPIRLVSVTTQQAEVEYASTIPGACTLSLADNSGLGVTVWDLNGSKFPGADQDIGRPDTFVVLETRKVLLGHRVYQQGSDGKIYSMSLQADAPHTLTVTCGSDSGTLQFATKTIPQGTAYPELSQYCSGSKTWGHCMPAIDWTVSGKDLGYVDAATGALVKRVTGPGESQNYPGTRSTVAFGGVKDQSGTSAWSNVTNALTYRGGTYASTSSNNAKLLLGFGHYGTWNLFGGFYGNGVGTVDDIELQLFASATSGDTISACLTIDGQTCWGGTVTRTPGASLSAIAFGDYPNTGIGSWPSNPWIGPFAGWSTEPLPSHLVAAAPMSATVNGTAVTLAAVNYRNGITFDDEWAAGSPIYIPTSSCTNNICTIASVADTSHLTINESQANLGTQTIQPLNAGVLIWKASGSGSVSLNASFNFAYSLTQDIEGSNGLSEQCSRVATTTSVDAGGKALTGPPHNGFLCWFTTQSVYFWDSTAGSARWLSDNNYTNVAGSSGNFPLTSNPFDTTLPNVWYTWFSGSQCCAGKNFFGKAAYDASFQYQRNNVVWPSAPPQHTTFTYPFGPADLTGTFNSFIASYPAYSAGVSAGVWPSFPVLVGLHPNGFAEFHGKFTQDTVAWIFPYSITGQNFTGAINTYSGNPGCTGTTAFCGRWGSWHTSQPSGNNNYGWVAVGRLTGLPGPNAPTGGPYNIPISQVWRSVDGVTGAWDSNTCVPDAVNSKSCVPGVGTLTYAYNCPADTSAYWHTTQAIANDILTQAGGSGTATFSGQKNCILVMASGQPCTPASNTNAQEISFAPCPWDTGTPKTTASLQDLQVGDTIMDSNDQSASPTIPCRNCEQLTVVQTSGSYPNKQIWLYRAYDPQDGSYSPYNNTGGAAVGKMAHLNGWTPRMTSGNDNVGWWTDFSHPTQWIVSASINGDHGANGHSPSPYILGGYTASGTGYLAQPLTSIMDVATTNTLIQTGYSQNFNRSHAFDSIYATLETYSSATAVNASNDFKRWISDYRTPQTGGGGPGSLGYGVTATVVGGAGHTHVYLLTSPTSTFDFKNSPWYGISGRWLLQDISGPSSSITDSTPSSFCYAYRAGECVSGSAANALYVNAPNIEPSTTCWSQAWDFSAPCVTPSYGVFGQSMMHDAYDPDPEGRRFMRLTGLFNPPYLSAGFEAMKFTPDGRWGLYKSWSASGYRPELFAVRIPTIAADTINRTAFIQMPVELPAGDAVSVRFGYDQSFRCHGVSGSQGNFIAGYNDACVTDGSGAQPFLFASEAQVPTPCPRRCTVNIPAISGRYLYYRIERYNAGVLTYQSPTQRQAVP